MVKGKGNNACCYPEIAMFAVPVRSLCLKNPHTTERNNHV